MRTTQKSPPPWGWGAAGLFAVGHADYGGCLGFNPCDSRGEALLSATFDLTVSLCLPPLRSNEQCGLKFFDSGSAIPKQHHDKLGDRHPFRAGWSDTRSLTMLVDSGSQGGQLFGLNDPGDSHDANSLMGRKRDELFQAPGCHARCGRQLIVHFLQISAIDQMGFLQLDLSKECLNESPIALLLFCKASAGMYRSDKLINLGK
jgi:hypothetical protein